MLKKLLFLLIGCLSLFSVAGQQDTVLIPTASPGSHLRISLITCGPGEQEIWEVFGHTAVRVVDSAHHTDLVYNYGTFNYGPGFELQFMQGKLLYCLSVAEFDGFIPEYIMSKRSVAEQVLLLSDQQKISPARLQNLAERLAGPGPGLGQPLRRVLPGFGHRHTSQAPFGSK